MKKQKEELTGLALALSFTNGNASALARIAGVSPQAVFQWKSSNRIPVEKAKHLAKVFGVKRELV